MTRDEVLKEFGSSHYNGPTTYEQMADEIVRLRELVSNAYTLPVPPVVAVTREMEDAFIDAYDEFEYQSGMAFTNRMGVNAGLTAALRLSSTRGES